MEELEIKEDKIKAVSDEKTYILAGHNGIARVVQSYFTDMTNEEYAAYDKALGERLVK